MSPVDNTSLGFPLQPETDSEPTYTQTRRVQSRVSGISGALVLGFSVITSPVSFLDPRRELQASGSATTLVVHRRKSARRVSLAEAWTRAGEIYTEAQNRRIQQREREAREFWSFVDESE